MRGFGGVFGLLVDRIASRSVLRSGGLTRRMSDWGWVIVQRRG
jgi:hypothetical protein